MGYGASYRQGAGAHVWVLVSLKKGNSHSAGLWLGYATMLWVGAFQSIELLLVISYNCRDNSFHQATLWGSFLQEIQTFLVLAVQDLLLLGTTMVCEAPNLQLSGSVEYPGHVTLYRRILYDQVHEIYENIFPRLEPISPSDIGIRYHRMEWQANLKKSRWLGNMYIRIALFI